VNRQAQAVVLFLLGGAVLRASLTDLFLRYVKAGLRPLLIAAGVVLIIAAIVTIWHEWRRPNPSQHPAQHPARDNDRGDHAHHEPQISWLLVALLLALILVTPSALGSYSAGRTGQSLRPPPGFPELPAGNPLQLEVDDYATRAVYDHGRSLGGRQFELTGFITLSPTGAPYLTRMFLSCCAADAQPIKVGLSGRIPPILAPNTWFEIIGTYTGKQTKDPINGGVIPFIMVDQADKTTAPGDPYET
jgi:uncharacterized repeat protein (TIGR03943 family)